MNNYVPFLKFKVNEIAALATLTPAIKSIIFPFLDLPKKNGMNEDGFMRMLLRSRRAYDKHLKNLPSFFLDNFDIDDAIKVAGDENYSAVIRIFGDLEKFVPVVGLDRPKSRNDRVFSSKAAGEISGRSIAIRLQYEDFQSFSLIKDELKEFKRKGEGLFDRWILVMDNRLCLPDDVVQRGNLINRFLQKAQGDFEFSSVIIAGSSIPASIRDLAKVQTELHQIRHELAIYRAVSALAHHPDVHFGDYTVVSPLYSDLNIPPEAMQNVIAAKTIYSYGDVHYIVRGGALKTHSRGRLQYNDIAARIVSQVFYRGPAFSNGDKFLYEKSQHIGSGVTPGTVIKPTINTHITYMINSFPG